MADLPDQPVHAFERHHIRFTRDIVIEGAEPEMKATSDMQVEYVDYDFESSDPRKVHITLVIKVWARVVTTTDMDVYALTPIDQIGEAAEQATAASTFNSDTRVCQPVLAVATSRHLAWRTYW